jgi:phosphoglycerate dehydrogenase-like enzyme
VTGHFPVVTGHRPPAVLVGPGDTGVVAAAVRDGGGRLVGDPRAADAVVWIDKDVAALRRCLHDGVRWVQLPDAGVERWLATGLLTGPAAVTSARGCYGPQVAEHALALVLGLLRRLPECCGLTGWPTGDKPWGRSLADAAVVLVGAGDIGGHLLRLLAPFGAEVTAVTRSGREVPGATRCVAARDLDTVLPAADVVVLAAPSTPETVGLLSAARLAALPPHAVLVNVGRGDVVDTAALVAALDDGRLAAAALDVTEPEPLPDGHPLWHQPHALITPHVANPPHLKAAALARRVRDNTGRLGRGEPLVGLVDPSAGY